jgi:hypothetical protein
MVVSPAELEPESDSSGRKDRKEEPGQKFQLRPTYRLTVGHNITLASP